MFNLITQKFYAATNRAATPYFSCQGSVCILAAYYRYCSDICIISDLKDNINTEIRRTFESCERLNPVQHSPCHQNITSLIYGGSSLPIERWILMIPQLKPRDRNQADPAPSGGIPLR